MHTYPHARKVAFPNRREKYEGWGTTGKIREEHAAASSDHTIPCICKIELLYHFEMSIMQINLKIELLRYVILEKHGSLFL